MATTFNPGQHPRDRFGRFTKSRTVKASAKDKAAAKRVAEAFQPAQVGDRQAYLRKLAGDDRTGQDFGHLADANRALRAGKGSPAADDLGKHMVDLPDDVLLSRTVPLSAFGHTPPQSLAGMKVRDAGFAPAQLGTVAAVDGQVRMHIAAPAGTKAAINPAMGEVLLDRDTEMVVARVDTNPAGGHDMFLTVLPKVGSPKADTSDSSSPAEGDGGRGDLMKLRVPALQAKMRERGLKPGRMRKSQMVDALVADETGAMPDKAVSFADRVAAATTGEQALNAVPFSLNRPDTHASPTGGDGLTAASRGALAAYRGRSYKRINQRLRDGKPDLTDDPEIDKLISDIDSATTASRLPADMLTYRGIRNPDRLFGDRFGADLTGMRWREDAYVSSSADPDTAGMFAGTRGVRMRLLTPAGVGAVQVSGVTDSAGHDDEAEVLLERGLTLHVTADRGVDPDGVRNLDVEVTAGA